MAAQSQIEKYLTIKIPKQAYEESKTYYRNEFQSTGCLQTTYPVKTPYKCDGYIGDLRQISYPKGWLTKSYGTNDVLKRFRLIYMVPNSQLADLNVNAALFGQFITPHLGVMQSGQIANYWRVGYITGFDYEDLPMDLLDIIGKLASIGLFNLLGDIVLGAGIASMSLGIDGLSQSINTTSSAENSAYSARIIMYKKEIESTLKQLKNTYKGITLVSI